MRKEKRIAVLGVSYPFRGGISHYSTLFVRELRKKYSVKFITLKRQYPRILFPGKTQYDYSAENFLEENDSIIDSINPFTWVKAALLLKKENIDLLIVQWWNPFFGFSFGTIANLLTIISKIKICFLCHNVLPHESTFLDQALIKYSFLNTQHFIVHSEEDRRNILSFKPNAIVFKNLHPTYTIFSNYSFYNKEESKKKLNIAVNKKIILFFGFIRPYKGLKYLLYAMKKVVKSVDCTLLIVGEFYESKKFYLSLIEKLELTDNIIIIDKYVNNEDVPLFFCSSDVVVLPYINATQSGIIQIAFGLNRPVITTNVGGLSEAVNDGKTGFVVDPESPDALHEAIIKYFNGNYEKKFCEEIKKNSRDFDWDIALSNIELLLERK
jgi:glycosyltransferase involved in cell wall biosynthesis